MKRALSIIAAAILPLLISCRDNIDYSVVKTLDIDRYMGKWYEIARFDNRFERGLVGVTAEYTLLDNNTIAVFNSGYRDSLNGERAIARGVAKRRRDKDAGALKVAFFWKFYTPYNILEVDQDNYSYALVGGHNDNYLWILSRTPQLDPEVLNHLMKSAKSRGYDTSKLLFVEHNHKN